VYEVPVAEQSLARIKGVRADPCACNLTRRYNPGCHDQASLTVCVLLAVSLDNLFRTIGIDRVKSLKRVTHAIQDASPVPSE
jgi:hypothetical protein